MYLAERAEALGFDSVRRGVSVTAKSRHELLTTLAAVATATNAVGPDRYTDGMVQIRDHLDEAGRGASGTPVHVAAELAAYEEAGVDELVVRFVTTDGQRGQPARSRDVPD